MKKFEAELISKCADVRVAKSAFADLIEVGVERIEQWIDEGVLAGDAIRDGFISVRIALEQLALRKKVDDGAPLQQPRGSN